MNTAATVQVPTFILEKRPAWTMGYTPAVDGKNQLWLWARFQDSIVWVQPLAWRDQAVDGVTNYGVDLGSGGGNTQAPGTVVTNDAAFGQAIAGATSGEQCPLPNPFRPTIDVGIDLSQLVLPGAVILGALILLLGLRRTQR
jgi:hypothetical protein